RLWELPDPVPELVGPAVSVESAARVAGWSDGLVTVNQPMDVLRDIVAAYRGAGGRGPMALQVHLSWADTDDEALRLAHEQWGGNVFGPPISWDIETAEAFDVLWQHVQPEEVRGAVNVSPDLGQHRDWLAEYAALGFDEIYLHHVGQEQAAFIQAFGEKVLPELRKG
ncbi:MAG TPA: hypothetical protein VFG94_11330, partial [Acidimicrobiales bacterium]|nr:hypothetical protein [Acidimicrobiales bacterium]